MFFDRYEIHIQAFVDFINGKLIIFQSSSPQNHFEHTYSKIYTKYIQNIYPKNKFKKKVGLPFENFRKFCSSDMEK